MILTLRVRPMLALVPFIFSFGAGLPASAQQARAMVITTTPTSSPTPMPSPTVTVPTPVTVTSTLTPDLSLAPSPTITLTTPSAPSPTIMPTTPSPTTITATRVTSTPTITMHTPSRSRIVSSSMAGTCPSGWTCADIGTPSLAGDQSLSGDTWTVSGAGTDIWGSADQFRYVWQNLGGDVSVTARALSQSNTGTHAKAGVMLRGSADPGAMFYYFQVEPGGTYYVTYRSGQGTMAQIAASFAGGLPYYVRVARAGDMFTAYTSGDGATWTAVPNSSVTLYMGHTQPILGGLAVSSTDPGTLGTATFGQVAVAASANSGPSVCPTGWQCADIGNPDLSGGQAISGSAVTIDGGGRDIWGSADQFRYIWQSFTSDATVSARITMQTHTSDYAKAGIMFRASAGLLQRLRDGPVVRRDGPPNRGHVPGSAAVLHARHAVRQHFHRLHLQGRRGLGGSTRLDGNASCERDAAHPRRFGRQWRRRRGVGYEHLRPRHPADHASPRYTGDAGRERTMASPL